MNLVRFLLLIIMLVIPAVAYADVQVVEGDEGLKLYQSDKGKAQVLVQKDKQFVFRAPGGQETPKPETVTVKVGERFYIANEETEVVHNVYDTSDSSWLLKKQEPSTAAAVTFKEPGKHLLRCAIHPTMKVSVQVVQ